MAEAVMGPLVGRLQELALSEARKMVALNEDIRSLHNNLMWMQAFLRDAAPRLRLRNDELIRVYLRQTRDAVFDAEDAVDQYFLQVDLSRFPTWSQAIVKFFTSLTTQVRVRINLSSRIKSINTRLEGIIANKEKYKMDNVVDAPITPWRPSTVISASTEKLDEDFVVPLVGRKDKLTELGDKLKMETEQLNPMVISVVGKSGVGKTMLVKDIYERLSTKNHFNVQAWVSFAPNLSASNIQMLILLRLTKDNVSCSKKEVANMLKRELEHKRYLLVIDGEVSSTEWNRILANLPIGNKKSRVVRTALAKPEEPPAGTFVHHKIELHPFNEDTSTKLFLETLFMEEKNGNHGGHSSFVSDRDKEKIFKAARDRYAPKGFQITDGLPLAVVLLSGLLRTKEYPVEWKKVFDHLKAKSKESKRLDNILSMCFDDLPHDLKSCFLSFAALPVNSLIRARTLVCMWMAEGFLRPKEGKTMEKVGEHYLKELVDRRLVILPPVESAAPGDERVTVQTKVHDFLVLEAQEANFVEIHDGDDVPTLSTARRLSLQNHRDKYSALGNPLRKLRSIFSNFEKEEASGNEEEEEPRTAQPDRPSPSCLPSKITHPNPKYLIRKLLQVSQFLRVIYLDGLEVGDELPSEIGNVVHLHYLGITSCSLQKIPPAIGRLKRLQTLDVRGTKVTTLPAEFWRIRTLRHVFGSNLHLPRRVGNLDLEQLQTLSVVRPGDGGGYQRVLGNMKRLQVLYISEVSENNAHALSVVCKLKYLVVLRIYGEKITGGLFTSRNLPRLQVMQLDGELMMDMDLTTSRFNLPNLTTLYLENTKVSQDFINKLGELPFLATLGLYRGSYRENSLVFAKGFHSLKKLMLYMGNKHIGIKGPAFPHIAILEIFVFDLDVEVPTLMIEGKDEYFMKKIKLEDQKQSVENQLPIY